MTRRGKSARRKGHNYENVIARLFETMGFPAKRHLEYQSEEAADGRDLDGTQPFAVQAKCWGRTPSVSAIEQVTPNGEYPIPMAFLKRTRKKGQSTLEVMVVPADVGLKMIALLRVYNLLGRLTDDRA